MIAEILVFKKAATNSEEARKKNSKETAQAMPTELYFYLFILAYYMRPGFDCIF